MDVISLLNEYKYIIILIILIIYLIISCKKKDKEGFDNDFTKYGKTLPPAYLNNSYKSEHNYIYSFHKGDGSYKKKISKDSNFDNKITTLTELLEKLIKKILIDDQDCKGKFTKYSECNKDCGDGKQTRKYIVTHKKGKKGKDCHFPDGFIEEIDCFNDICELDEECEMNQDCSEKNCNPETGVCEKKDYCSGDKLYLCEKQECIDLNNNNNNNDDNENMNGSYLWNNTDQACFFKTPAEMKEIVQTIYAYAYDDPESENYTGECIWYQEKGEKGKCVNRQNITTNASNSPECVEGWYPAPNKFNVKQACTCCHITQPDGDGESNIYDDEGEMCLDLDGTSMWRNDKENGKETFIKLENETTCSCRSDEGVVQKYAGKPTVGEAACEKLLDNITCPPTTLLDLASCVAAGNEDTDDKCQTLGDESSCHGDGKCKWVQKLVINYVNESTSYDSSQIMSTRSINFDPVIQDSDSPPLITSMQTNKYIDINYEGEQVCNECPIGYTSASGTECKKCPDGWMTKISAYKLNELRKVNGLQTAVNPKWETAFDQDYDNNEMKCNISLCEVFGEENTSRQVPSWGEIFTESEGNVDLSGSVANIAESCESAPPLSARIQIDAGFDPGGGGDKKTLLRHCVSALTKMESPAYASSFDEAGLINTFYEIKKSNAATDVATDENLTLCRNLLYGNFGNALYSTHMSIPIDDVQVPTGYEITSVSIKNYLDARDQSEHQKNFCTVEPDAQALTKCSRVGDDFCEIKASGGDPLTPVVVCKGCDDEYEMVDNKCVRSCSQHGLLSSNGLSCACEEGWTGGICDIGPLCSYKVPGLTSENYGRASGTRESKCFTERFTEGRCDGAEADAAYCSESLGRCKFSRANARNFGSHFSELLLPKEDEYHIFQEYLDLACAAECGVKSTSSRRSGTAVTADEFEYTEFFVCEGDGACTRENQKCQNPSQSGPKCGVCTGPAPNWTCESLIDCPTQEDIRFDSLPSTADP